MIQKYIQENNKEILDYEQTNIYVFMKNLNIQIYTNCMQIIFKKILNTQSYYDI